MAANPTFGLYTELSVHRIGAQQWQGYECTMCQGTGRVLNGKTAQCAGFPKYMIRRIEELVGKHLEDGVDITEISSRLGYSSSHFFRMFRRSFGITPHTYVMRRRLALAQQLLARTDLGLVDIALKAGFCDQSHLSRSFRRFAGLPPRAYRALLRTVPDGDATVAATESGSLRP
jgi:AraC-like DNA-binding protein